MSIHYPVKGSFVEYHLSTSYIFGFHASPKLFQHLFPNCFGAPDYPQNSRNISTEYPLSQTQSLLNQRQGLPQAG